MKSTWAKPGSFEQKWYLYDAENVILKDKKYYWHTGYLGGIKERSYAEMMDRKPEEVLRLAVERMLPKTTLGRKMIKKLKIYAGAEHPHAAQMPVKVDM